MGLFFDKSNVYIISWYVKIVYQDIYIKVKKNMRGLLNVLTEAIETIGKISTSISVDYEFYLRTTFHSDSERRTRLDPYYIKRGYDQTPVTDKELVDFFKYFEHDIAVQVSIHNIVLNQTFVIRSISKKFACAVALDINRDEDFVLRIATVMRENDLVKLDTYPGQLIITKD